MSTIITKLFDFQNPEIFDFQVGYVSGVGLAIAIILLAILVKILHYFFRYPRKLSGISIPGTDGEIFISAGAITDLVKSTEDDFQFVTISKVQLLDKKIHHAVDLHIDFDIEGGRLPLISSELQLRVLSNLKDTFGIDSIKEVNIRIRKVTLKKKIVV